MTQKFDAYQEITDRIIAALESGTIPWRRPWRTAGLAGPNVPRNAITNRPYRGINVFLLGLQPYATQQWLTYKQAAEAGGNVRKGEHGTQIIFWSIIPIPGAREDEPQTRAILRTYRVFNLAQTENVKLPRRRVAPATITEEDAIEAAEAVYENMPARPPVHYGADAAWYVPTRDEIHLPDKTAFTSLDAFYATQFHELSHSTGHKSRLNRHGFEDLLGPFGSAPYSKEELVAELPSAFLCQSVGIDSQIPQHAAYVQSWITALHNDRNLIVWAAARAQKAATYILNETAAEEEDLTAAAA